MLAPYKVPFAMFPARQISDVGEATGVDQYRFVPPDSEGGSGRGPKPAGRKRSSIDESEGGTGRGPKPAGGSEATQGKGAKAAGRKRSSTKGSEGGTGRGRKPGGG